jgi:glycosyltransferase involved in cell wall biosynthesis
MISVCIATFNGERFIKEQLLSIIPQLGSGDEIIISDDGSTDQTLNIVRAINSPFIRIVHNQGDHGYTPNFENAIMQAQGDYIYLCDQDDLWQPNKVAVCQQHLQSHDLVISDATLVNGHNEVIADSFFALRKSRPGLLANIVRFSYLGCCIAFRSALLRKACPFPPNHLYCTHDNWLTLVAMTYYKALVIDDRLIRYRRYDSNTSSGGITNSTNTRFKIAYRLYLLYWLVRRVIK